MLKLRNLKKNNGIITAEYDPENSGDLGSISINMENGQIIETVCAKVDEVFPIYLNHAIDALKKLTKERELPKEKTIMWY